MSDSPYAIDRGSNWRRKAVEEWLFGLDLVTPETRERIVTAWVSAWASSPYERLEDMPFQPGEPFYPLAEHVNEVTRAGVDLAKRAAADWGEAGRTVKLWRLPAHPGPTSRWQNRHSSPVTNCGSGRLT